MAFPNPISINVNAINSPTITIRAAIIHLFAFFFGDDDGDVIDDDVGDVWIRLGNDDNVLVGM